MTSRPASLSTSPPTDPRAAARPWVRSLLDLLVPVRCAGCGEAGPSPCPRCCVALARAVPQVLTWAPVAVPVVGTAGYGGSVRGMLLAHKERGRAGLATPLGAALGLAVVRALHEVDEPLGHTVLVPVPSSAAAVRGRGRRTVVELAAAASRGLDAPGSRVVVGSWLRPVRHVRDQAGLTAAQRGRNLAHAFEAQPLRGAPRTVVVVDDIVTTGASVAESVRALTAAGHHVVACAAVAFVSPGRASAAAGRRD